MNSRERMEAVLSGNIPDRPPVSMGLSLYGAGLTHCPLLKYYSDPGAYASGQDQVRRIFQPDILFAPFAMPLYAQAFGGTLRFYENQPPNMKTPALLLPKDFHSLSLPDPDTNPSLVYIRRAIRTMRSRHGGEVAIAGVGMDPVSLPIMLMGLDKWLETFLFEKQLAEDILGWIQPFFREWVNILFEEGTSFVALPMAFTTPAIVPRKLVTERCLPLLKQAFEGINGPLVLHSTGAPFARFLDLFAQLPNVRGGNSTAGIPLKMPGKPSETVWFSWVTLRGRTVIGGQWKRPGKNAGQFSRIEKMIRFSSWEHQVLIFPWRPLLKSSMPSDDPWRILKNADRKFSWGGNCFMRCVQAGAALPLQGRPFVSAGQLPSFQIAYGSVPA